MHALGQGAQLLHQRAQGRHLGPDRGVVPLDGHELRRRHARDQVHLAGAPVAHHSAGDSQLVGGVVLQGDASRCRCGCPGRPWPTRRPRGRGPGRSRSRSWSPTGGSIAGVNACTNGCMSVLDRSCFSYQVAAGSRTSPNRPVEVIRKSMLTSRSSLPSGVSSRQVTSCGRSSSGVSSARTALAVPSRCLRKNSLPLELGAQQVGPPHGEHPRPVLRGVGILDGELQLTGLQLFHHVVRRGHPRGLGVLGDGQRVAVQGGEAGHPPRARGLREGVDHRAAREPALAQRRGQALGAEGVVAPLAGVDVPERGADHLPRRPRPVQAERQLRPAGDGAALLLADVVRPAAAVDALAAGERDQGQERPVDRVGVEPVVGARARG